MSSLTRKKSCHQCRHAKTRCSLTVPICTRCEGRNLPCKYDSHERKSHAAPLVDGNSFRSWNLPTPDVLNHSVQDEVDGIPKLIDFNMSPIPVLGEDLGLGMDWNTNTTTHWPTALLPTEVDRDQAHILETTDQDSISWFEMPSSTPGHKSLSPNPDTDIFSLVSLASNTMFQNSNLIQESWDALQEIRDSSPNILNLKTQTRMSLLIKRNFVWTRMKSYAEGFAEGILTPFIHLTSSKELPEALANCKVIVMMYMKRTTGNTTLVFRTLLLEIQRFHGEFCKYDENTLIQALQALTVYVIMLAADKDRCILISMVVRILLGELVSKVNQKGYISDAERRGNFPSWEDWIQVESKRRTFLLLHLADSIIDTNIGAPRSAECSQIDNIPLPCSNILWQADTRTKWEDEYKRYMSTKECSGMLMAKSLRDSIKLQVVGVEIGLREDISRWAEDVDEIGTMLIMVFPGL